MSIGEIVLAFVHQFAGGWQGVSYAAIFGGLILAVVNAIRFLRGSVMLSTDPVAVMDPFAWRVVFWSAVPSIYWPLALIWAGFQLGGLARLFWQLTILVLVGMMVSLSIRMLRHESRTADEVAGTAVAVVISLSALLMFGLLFIARLTTARTSEVFDGGADLFGDSFYETTKSLVVAPGVLLLVLIGMALWRGSWRDGPVRTEAARERARWRSSMPPLRMHGRLGWWVAFGGIWFVAALFIAPYIGYEHLSIFGIQTQEFGKLAYFAVLALILIRYSDGFRIQHARSGSAPGPSDGMLMSWADIFTMWARAISRRAHIGLPLVLFGAVAIANTVRGDLGPTVPMLLATVPVVLLVVRVQARRSLTATKSAGIDQELVVSRNSWLYSKPLFTIAGLFLVIAVVTTALIGHGRARVDAWADPWAYPWTSQCSNDLVADPAPMALPAGSRPCLYTFAAVRANERSQVSQAVAVLNDGGLWGRGLADSTSGRVPAGPYDFILALIWSKLGALVVLLLSSLIVLLAYALARLPIVLRNGSRAGLPGTVTFAPVYAAGIAATILAQFVLQLTMTVGLVPHSGLTAPFLSQGFQSTVAMGLGVITAVVAAYRSAPASGKTDPGFVVRSTRRRPRLPVAFVVFATVLVVVIGTIVEPYQGLSEARRQCTERDVDRDTGQVHSTECSTDLVASASSNAFIDLGGGPAFEWGSGTWMPTGSSGLSVADMGGILLPGVLPSALSSARANPQRAGAAARLIPPVSKGGAATLKLTVVPGIQRAIATATESNGPDDAMPLPAGVAVLDAGTGAVLGLASAPTRRAATAATVSHRSWDAQGDFERALAQANRRIGQWRLDGHDVERSVCDGLPEAKGCVQWQAIEELPRSVSRDPADLRRFVAGDQTVRLPADDENRFFGTTFGLGSSFKVVIAAAYLRQEGTTADDLLPAPKSVIVNGQTIENYGNSACPFAVDDKISLTNALAVSCNTAFVLLVQRLGWDRVRDTAELFGFQVDATESDTAWLTGGGTGVASTVPSDPKDVGNVALGGGAVAGTPLQMATVMAAVANHGKAIEPSLVSTVTYQDNPAATWVSAAQSRTVMSPTAAQQLRIGLARTVLPGGTAAGMKAPDGGALWVKSGTHELLSPNQPSAPGDFVRQIAWMVGFVEIQGHGPVAFAVEVATRDERAGAQRVRFLAQQTIDAIAAEGR
ncbi:penicillin-binding transpeptidase domain-containing protein [Nocardia sp. NPDC052001]|uniref:penicillin-binding transpeptidase domain-containing protein n=1 Tax=Nocardia sp. NPDC052001 TaxID=3154853 RepID=UPI0034478E74